MFPDVIYEITGRVRAEDMELHAHVRRSGQPWLGERPHSHDLISLYVGDPFLGDGKVSKRKGRFNVRASYLGEPCLLR